MVGFVAFQNVRAKALDAKRRADIDAIKKAYETNFDPTLNNGQGGYKPLADSQFASGKIPTPDGSNNTSYIVVGPDNSAIQSNLSADRTYGPNYAACINLADGTRCAAPTTLTGSSGCYCASSTGGASLANTGSSCDAYNLLTVGLLGRWRLNGDALDVTNHNNGTWAGGEDYALGVNSSFGRAGSFKGNNYISLPNPTVLQVTNAVTAAAWVNLVDIANAPSDTGIIVKDDMQYGITRDERVQSGTSNARIWSYINGGSNTAFADLPSLGQWHHVALTYDKSLNSDQQKLYIDGAVKATKNYGSAPSILTSAANLYIGTYAQQQNFRGLIDDVRIYNRALSASEVSLLYNNGNGCVN